MELYDGVGANQAENESSGVGANAREIYTPTATGTYYLSVGEVDGETGTYTLSVIVLGANGASEADTDFPETTATTGRVEVGASATGNLSTTTDVDWFKVVLETGKTYQIDMKGLDGGGGTIGDPYLHDIRDSSGTGISDTGNDDVDADNDIYDSQITFTATTAGAYYLVAAGGGRQWHLHAVGARGRDGGAGLHAERRRHLVRRGGRGRDHPVRRRYIRLRVHRCHWAQRGQLRRRHGDHYWVQYLHLHRTICPSLGARSKVM